MQYMRYVFAAKLRAYRKILRRIVVESQVAPSFCTGAPKHEKLRFSAESDGFLRASCWTQAEYFCRSWKCVWGQWTLKVSMARRINTFGLSRFLHSRVPGGSLCVRQMSHILTCIIRAHDKTLRRIV